MWWFDAYNLKIQLFLIETRSSAYFEEFHVVAAVKLQIKLIYGSLAWPDAVAGTCCAPFTIGQLFNTLNIWTQ